MFKLYFKNKFEVFCFKRFRIYYIHSRASTVHEEIFSVKKKSIMTLSLILEISEDTAFQAD